ncbi:MAG: SNF2-related protein [Roseiarcus sp.]|jgi:hypothetical protein
MLNVFRGKATAPANAVGMWRAFCEDGLVLARREVDLSPGSLDARRIESAALDGLIAQIDDEGLTVPQGQATLLPWDHVFQLLANPHYRGCREMLGLPDDTAYVPALESRRTLTDRDFSIAVASWHDPAGGRPRDLEVCGAILNDDAKLGLAPRQVWETLSQISRFQDRPDTECDSVSQRRHWGQIRRTAISAGARLDGFLSKSVVLTPEKLDIGLRGNEVGGARVVEILPSFEGAPSNWLDVFDSSRSVPDLYNIPSPDGIVQVLVSPHVKTVLESIKRLPGRRVAGARAEAFLVNPYAALGEAASETIDEAQFLNARANAGLLFERFFAHIERDALGYPMAIGLQIEVAKSVDQIESEFRPFADDDELKRFIDEVESALAGGHQLCGWDGYDFELLGETERELDLLKQALKARREPRILVRYASIYDLSAYSSRIETIGVEKAFYSPFIAKKDDGEGWFPENIVPVISWIPEGKIDPVAVPVTPEAKEQIQAKINEARANGEDSFSLKGFDKPIPVSEAEFILQTFKNVHDDAQKGQFAPAKPEQERVSRSSKHLVIKANIQSIDYEEARRDILRNDQDTPRLPSGLRPTVVLKDHQISGVAWLQHLFGKAPDHCRGAVLADDMGLGKTLQLLTLLAWAFEMNPSLPPALIVAPVSLLENWEDEAQKFFAVGALSLLTAYGDSLASLRVSRDNIDDQLKSEGMVKFLKPDWVGTANVVLTTYETLRDLEFSFGAEKWSVMICDEAQRIKNPNAMVTRAAKKQNVIFRVACTGTPVENTLTDLWCLFDYVQPGLLGALNDFGRRYRRPIEAETVEEHERVEELRTRISPQILRRTKLEVAKDLKAKIDVPSKVPLSAQQRALYANAVNLFKTRDQPGTVSPFKNHLGLLHYLRLICTDPRRIGLSVFQPEALDQYEMRAPKLAWLLRTLKDIRAKDEKVIIFCEFREIQRMLRHYVEEVFGFAPDIINGDTSASAKHVASRQKRITAFQAKAGFGVIILSPVAVGFGVNIQAANHVVHYTRNWNPAKEDQATDRAYRMGQTREVYVYCPIVVAEDFTTFDVKLDRLLTVKRGLAVDMLNGAGDVAPGEFALEDVVPGSGDEALSSPITLDDVIRMDWSYFECLVAAIWQKRGFKTVYRTPQHDDGVDVVAISGSAGVLLQCKTSGSDGSFLSWDAVKEVVAGEAAYRMRHPGVSFRKMCITNQFFNDTAKAHADLNQVELLNQNNLDDLLQHHKVTTLDVEKLLYAEWESVD